MRESEKVGGREREIYIKKRESGRKRVCMRDRGRKREKGRKREWKVECV